MVLKKLMNAMLTKKPVEGFNDEHDLTKIC